MPDPMRLFQPGRVYIEGGVFLASACWAQAQDPLSPDGFARDWLYLTMMQWTFAGQKLVT
jgi:hypothetical protein